MLGRIGSSGYKRLPGGHRRKMPAELETSGRQASRVENTAREAAWKPDLAHAQDPKPGHGQFGQPSLRDTALGDSMTLWITPYADSHRASHWCGVVSPRPGATGGCSRRPHSVEA
ncbi:hypothetical protein GCM10009743_07940 [Kribbella swartbergensis]